MPDTDSHSIVATVDAIAAEAKKWRKLSDQMAAVHTDVSRLELFAEAFFFADEVSVTEHTIAYATFHVWYQQLLADATTEFDQIATALDASATAYADADTRASIDLQAIYGSRPEGH